MYFILYLIIGVAFSCAYLKWNGERELEGLDIFLVAFLMTTWIVTVPALAVILLIIYVCVKLNKLINK